MYKLFLDDYRKPTDCRKFPGDETEYDIGGWVIVRTFDEFCNTIKDKGIPSLVSFDYDLGSFSKEDGLDCAKFLVFECEETNTKLPDYLVHSSWPGIQGEFMEILNK